VQIALVHATHELRHTATSLAIASGANVKVVQTMLGHRSATITLDLYGHLFPDQLDQLADALDAAHDAAVARCRPTAKGSTWRRVPERPTTPEIREV
jgi:site-specific recombinase XerC